MEYVPQDRAQSADYALLPDSRQVCGILGPEDKRRPMAAHFHVIEEMRSSSSFRN